MRMRVCVRMCNEWHRHNEFLPHTTLYYKNMFIHKSHSKGFPVFRPPSELMDAVLAVLRILSHYVCASMPLNMSSLLRLQQHLR